jgi:hypothetical protein
MLDLAQWNYRGQPVQPRRSSEFVTSSIGKLTKATSTTCNSPQSEELQGGRGSKSSWNRENDPQLATCVAVAFVKGAESATHSLRHEHGSLVPAAQLAPRPPHRYPSHRVTTLSPNPVAIQAVKYLRPHAGPNLSPENLAAR